MLLAESNFTFGSLAALLIIGFCIWMFIDCIANETNEQNTKLVWILVMVVFGPIGITVYFFKRYLKRPKETDVLKRR